MAETEKTPEAAPLPTVPPTDGSPPAPPRRSPGHRGADVKDTVAEMAAKAHEISLEAGSKMAAAMKDVVNAAAGLSGFVIESARDLVQFMVRRGQMTQEEADKLIRQVEEHQPKRKPFAPTPAAGIADHAPKSVASHAPAVRHPPSHHAAPVRAAQPAAKTTARPAAKPAAKPAARPAAKPAAKRAAKPAAKPAAKSAAKKTTKAGTKSAKSPMKKPAAKKSAPKSAPKKAKAPARPAKRPPAKKLASKKAKAGRR